MEHMALVLLVEDDARIGTAVDVAMRGDGHQVRWERTGAGGLQAAAAGLLDLVLLDLGLPDRDGLDVCRAVRECQPSCVIVILTARGEEMDVVVGLESGADDYVTKPFGLAELLARVRAHLRRRARDPRDPQRRTVADLVIDARSRRCLVAGVEELRARQGVRPAARLARDPGLVVSRERLMAEVWDENWFGSTKTLDVHIAALRARLGAARADRPAGANGRAVRMPTITTLRGRGYRLDP